MVLKYVKQYAIYEHPDDYPQDYVVRTWLITDGGVLPGGAKRTTTLEEARALLPASVTRISGRDAQVPKLIEVWM